MIDYYRLNLMMKHLLILLVSVILLESCSSTFSPYAKYNQTTDSYFPVIYNKHLKDIAIRGQEIGIDLVYFALNLN